MNSILCNVLVIGFFFIPFFANAAVIGYDSFDGPTLNFDALADASNPSGSGGDLLIDQYLASDGVAFSVANNKAFSFRDRINVQQNSAQDLREGLAIAFTDSVSSLGLWIFGSARADFTFRTYNSEGLLIDDVTVGAGAGARNASNLLAQSFNLAFSGDIANLVAYSTVYSWSNYGVLNSAVGSFAFDDLKYAKAPTAVPEPSSLLLLLVGAVGLVFQRKRGLKAGK